MERLTVLSVAFPLAPVGLDAVGGAEQVLAALDAALVRAGHRSLVVACEGSSCRGIHIPTPRREELDDTAHEAAHATHREAVSDALRRFDVDIIHLHGLDFAAYLPPPGPPALATLHLPPGLYPPEALCPDRPRTWLCCVSASQQRTCPPGLPLLGPVPNGVDLEAFRPRGRKRGFALALGRICREKGFHEALDAARAVGLPLLLGGDVFAYPAHQEYFAREILPRLDRHRRFLGPVGLRRKARLLAAARCLVVPSRIAETSSLVAMEALASGTPVIAHPAGALPEIIEHGRTGFLAESADELAEALRRIDEIDPRACRRAAEERFSADRMVAGYLSLYASLAHGDPS